MKNQSEIKALVTLCICTLDILKKSEPKVLVSFLSTSEGIKNYVGLPSIELDKKPYDLAKEFLIDIFQMDRKVLDTPLVALSLLPIEFDENENILHIPYRSIFSPDVIKFYTPRPLYEWVNFNKFYELNLNSIYTKILNGR